MEGAGHLPNVDLAQVAHHMEGRIGIKRELSRVFLHKQHPNTQILIIQGLGYVNGQGANNRWDVRRDGALFPAR